MLMTTDDSVVRVLAPAKLNLFLEVLRKRSDGFHEIQTLITAIDIYDFLELQPNESGDIELSCQWLPGWEARSPNSHGPRRDGELPQGQVSQGQVSQGQVSQGQVWSPLPSSKNNLVHQALSRLREVSGSSCGATVRLRKSIPSEAGLGGASSDAAAAMAAANHAWRLGWSRKRLAELASELGSDLPFFFESGAAICSGRGENARSIRIRPLHFVLLKPPVGLSTAAVYEACKPGQPQQDMGELEEAICHGSPQRIAKLLFNRLEAPSEELTPWVNLAREHITASGSLTARMTGSGTCCFGVYRSARHARRAAAWLRQRKVGGVCSATSCGGHANQLEGVA